MSIADLATTGESHARRQAHSLDSCRLFDDADHLVHALAALGIASLFRREEIAQYRYCFRR